MHMKKTSGMTVLLMAAAFAVTASAQTSGTAADLNQSTSAAAHAGRAGASADQATNVSAQLTRSINSRHAKVGDEVVAKTTENARLADGTRLPKGSRLIGHVTQVQAKSRAEHDGELAFSFDHAILRNGREVPIHAVMESVSAPRPPSISDDAMAQGDAGAGPAMGGGGMRGGVSRGGGLLGGGGGGVVGGAAAPVGDALNGTAGAAGNLAGNTASGLNAAGNGAVNSAASLGRNSADLGGSAEGDSGLSGRAFPVGNLSGVTFTNLGAARGADSLTSSGSATGSASALRHGLTGSAGAQNATLFTAHGRNVELEGGSQMTMSVTPQSH